MDRNDELFLWLVSGDAADADVVARLLPTETQRSEAAVSRLRDLLVQARGTALLSTAKSMPTLPVESTGGVSMKQLEALQPVTRHQNPLGALHYIEPHDAKENEESYRKVLRDRQRVASLLTGGDDAIEEILSHRISKNTQRAYREAVERFSSWCKSRGLQDEPASVQTLKAYVAERIKTVSYSTVLIDCSGIRRHHLTKGIQSPTDPFEFRDFMLGVRNKVGVGSNPKTAATAEVTKKFADTCDQSSVGIRDRALVLLMFASGMRRSEIVGISWQDIEWLDNELQITIRKSKTDQSGKGRLVRIMGQNGAPYCPISALQRWMRFCKETTGAVFRSLSKRSYGRMLTAAYVAVVIKNAARAAGMDETSFSGHSMRRGHVTQAARVGKKIDEIMSKTGHKDANTVVRYIEQNKKIDEGMLD